MYSRFFLLSLKIKSQKMKKIILSISILCFAFVAKSFQANSTHATDEKAGVEAALAWLKINDAGDYAKSYAECGKIFQSALTVEKWTASVGAVMKPLGKMKTRENISAKYTTTVPGAPDGEYVIMQFKTSFENKKEAIETVSVVKENGVWKVVGYYIK
jgi:Protein of unknown function (DUF4019)